MKKTNYIAELIFLGFLLLVAIAFAVQLIEPENDPLQIVDSVEYARVIVGLFLVSVVAVLIQSLVKFSRYVKTHPKEETAAENSPLDKLVLKLIIATGAVFFFYCWFMQRLGYYASGFVVLEIYQMILYKAQEGHLDRKGVLKITAISIGVTAALYLLFTVAFELYLPRGILR